MFRCKPTTLCYNKQIVLSKNTYKVLESQQMFAISERPTRQGLKIQEEEDHPEMSICPLGE